MGEDMVDSPTVEEAITITPTIEKKYFRSGGAYVPPQRAALMQEEVPEVGSEAYQRLAWEALRKSLNGLINKVSPSNIKEILVELFGENLVRGRGLLVRAVMRAQAAALPFTGIYAAMLAVVNTKIPMVGELLVTRLINQFRRAYRRNDKNQCLATTTFLAHLVNQKVAHEIVALQLLTLLLERPTDDSVEIGVGLMRECGAVLAEISPRPSNAIFERFRVILHEGLIDKRVQYMVEVLFQLRKDGFKGHEAIQTELDLVPEEDQITHYVSLDDELDPQDGLNVFKADPEYAENEAKYEAIRAEILGDDDEDQDQEEDQEEEDIDIAASAGVVSIKDETSTDLINLRKTIYLTVMSSVDFEECGHKLLKLNIPEGLEIELCNMIVECCSQERTYLRFFGLLAERFCKLDPVWQESFEQCFVDVYGTVHRLETGKIRNVGKMFGHLLYTSAISWGVLGCIRLSEEGTTSASRIFLKFLLQELLELMGMAKLVKRLQDPSMLPTYFSGLFPRQPPSDTRFAINYYTAIGMGPLTDALRDHLARQVDDGDAGYEEVQLQERGGYDGMITASGEGMHGERAALLGLHTKRERSLSPTSSEDSYASRAGSISRPRRDRSPSPTRSRSRSRSPARHDRRRDRSPSPYKRRSDPSRSPRSRRDRSRGSPPSPPNRRSYRSPSPRRRRSSQSPPPRHRSRSRSRGRSPRGRSGRHHSPSNNRR